MNFTRIVSRVLWAVVLGLSLSGCNSGDKPATSSVRMKVDALTYRYQVTRIAVDVQPGNVQSDLTYNSMDGSFTGALIVPVGTQTFTATAYADTLKVGTGTATAQILENQTALVSLVILDTTGAPAVPDHGPVIVSLVVPKTSIIAGDSVTFSATAVDPDGDPLSYSWTQSCATGVFTSPNTAETSWSSSSETSCAITLTASANGLQDAKSFNMLVYPASGGAGAAQISGQYVEQPVITNVSLSANGYYCGVDRYWTTNATCAGSLSPTQSANVSFSYSGSASTPCSTSLVDDCGGTVSAPMPMGQGYAYYSWTAPATSGLCLLTAGVSCSGLSDAYPVAVLVTGCVDDAFEPNNSPWNATWLYWMMNAIVQPGLYANDDDWFRFSSPVAGLRVSVTGPALGIELYASDAVTLLASGTGSVDYVGSQSAQYFVHIAPENSGACATAYELHVDPI